MKEARFSCDCHGHCYIVAELDEDEPRNGVEFAFWQYGRYDKAPWRWRVKTLWRLIRYGEATDAWVVLSRAEANRLALFLLAAPSQFDNGNPGTIHVVNSSTLTSEAAR